MKKTLASALLLCSLIGPVLALGADKYSPEILASEKFFPKGQSYEADFGPEIKFRLDFHSSTKLTFSSLIDKNLKETVDIEVTEISPKVYMVSWKEKSGIRVIHVEDFNRNVIYTNIFMNDGTTVRKKGSIKKI